MPDIKILIAEFIAITAFCKESGKGYYVKKNKYFAVDKSIIVELLERNNYEASFAKLAIWKRLRWIDTDAGHITKSVYIKDAGKSVRMIVIDLDVHAQLAELEEKVA